MKRLTVALGIALFALAATPTYAQQPPGQKDPHHPEPPAAMAPATPPAPPGPAPAGGMMPMEMCRQMMGGPMMDMPVAGEGQRMDPKTTAQMMEMRGEMMKAMGDVMLKHAKKMQGPPKGR